MDRRPHADRSFEALRRRIERAVHEARTGDAELNLSARVNRSVVVNCGRSGAQQAATSRQTVPIRQQSGGPVDAEPATNVAPRSSVRDTLRDRSKEV